jgi:purine-nucleoside phosphorylase
VRDPAASSGSLASVEEAVRSIRVRSDLQPRIGLVLGSGLGAFADSLQDAARVAYGEIPGFPVSTAIGHKGELVLGRARGVPVAVMAGRVHRYEGYSLAQVVFPVRVLARLGAEVLVLTNAAGGVNTSFRPGELMLIDDHINLMGDNPLVGPNEEAFGPRFFDMSAAYDPALREIAERACTRTGVVARRGVYLALTGPSYETPAEIRMMRMLGADAVGMSTVPEVIAARHMGLRVLGVSCITNMAAGVTGEKLDHKEVLEVGEKVAQGLLEVLGIVVEEATR